MTEERILDFLDGNLDASSEEELLHRLAVSPERRNLLRQHLQMRELTASLARRQYVPVPKVVTASLFTTLAANGYAGPSMPATNESQEVIAASLVKNVGAAAENIVAKAPGVFRRSTLALTSLASFLIGGAVIYLAMPQTSQEKMPLVVNQTVQRSSSPANLSQQSTPQMASVVAQLPKAASVKNVSNNIVSHVNEISSNSSSIGITDKSSKVLQFAPPSERNTEEVFKLPGKDFNFASITPIGAKYETVVNSQDIIGSNGRVSRNPFDLVSEQDDQTERTFWNRVTLSLRAGEGKSPGNAQALTGSLIELKTSVDISDLLIAKVSFGQFMPYEMQAVEAHPGFNSDGIRLLQLSPVVQYRYVVGAEMGAKFNMFSTPFELTGGFISDLQGNIIPRAGLFTSLSLQEDLSMNLGVEAMIYKHDIRSSLQNAQRMYSGEHPSLIGGMQESESTGFVGPSIELVWHF